MSLYEFTVQTSTGSEQSLQDFAGQVLLIVNTASKCGFTPQYEGLEKLYEQHKEAGFSVLAFPCNQFANQEPGTDAEIQSFCQVNYAVTFPVFAKIDVNGAHAHPLFKYLTTSAPGIFNTELIKWNFTKFLVDRHGQIIKRYAPNVKPEDIEADLQSLLAKS